MSKQSGAGPSTPPRIPSIGVPPVRERNDGHAIPPTPIVHPHPIPYPTVDPKTGR